jgi:hypothetical protein
MISWRSLHERINELSEADIEQLLDDELKEGARAAFLERLHRRLCALRASRERIELMGRARRG